ncbi:MAG: hypothetical protein AAF658_14985 [Myxococcota bacterium]
MWIVAIPLLLSAAILELILGARLLWLARITRGAAETSIGIAFFLDAFAQVAGAVAGELDGVARIATQTASLTLTLIATGALYLGVVRVFEQHRPWLLKASWGVVLAVAAAQAFVFVATGPDLDAQFITARWVNRGFSAFTFVWAVAASLGARSACLRQMKLGLSSRLEAARFLLWALAAIAFLIVLALLFARDVLGMPSTVTAIAHPFLAVACVTAVWWTFFPPRWLERRLVVVQ